MKRAGLRCGTACDELRSKTVWLEFNTQEVFIRKDTVTGNLIFSRRHDDWSGFLATAETA